MLIEIWETQKTFFLIYGGNLNVKKLFGSEKSLGDT